MGVYYGMNMKEGLKENPALDRAASSTFGLTRQRQLFLDVVNGMGVDKEKLAGIMEKSGNQIISEIGDVFLYQKEKLLEETFKLIDGNQALTEKQKEEAKAFAKNEKLWESLTESMRPAVEKAKNRTRGKENESGQESAISRLVEVLRPRTAKLVTNNGMIDQFSLGEDDSWNEKSRKINLDTIGGGAFIVSALVLGYVSISGVSIGMDSVKQALGTMFAIAVTTGELGMLINSRLKNSSLESETEKAMFIAIMVSLFAIDALATYVSFGGASGLPEIPLEKVNQIILRVVGAFGAAIGPELFFIKGLDMLGFLKKKSESRNDVSFQMEEPEEEYNQNQLPAPTQNRKRPSFIDKLRDEIASRKRPMPTEEVPRVITKQAPTIWRKRDSANQESAETKPKTARNNGSWSAPQVSDVEQQRPGMNEGDMKDFVSLLEEERNRKIEEDSNKARAKAAERKSRQGQAPKKEIDPVTGQPRINSSTGFGKDGTLTFEEDLAMRNPGLGSQITLDDRKVNSNWIGLIEDGVREKAAVEGLDYNAVLGYIATRRNQLSAITDLNSRVRAGEKITNIISSQN